uniref:Polymerase PB2 n=1 Tax=Wuhan Mosquito Virus 4 TaxID=1608129 RepID=A0A1L3KKC4_9ORTO|nr:polymerase PB2 [Wuhan Mosquito Virus 4]APG77887.1 polymerase PB2 [Wuhan Mosquito Virus 4]
MENQEQLEARKKRLLMIAKAIVQTSPGARKILRKVPICNLRQISKEAKNLKDPNPLMSTMNSVSQKYPISVDKRKAKLAGLPREFLHESDTHQSGRQLCKMEAIKWFIENGPQPTEGVAKSVGILFKYKESQVAEYHSWNWAAAKLYFGEQALERRWVQTRTPLVEISRAKKNIYVIAALFPENIVNWRSIDKGILDQIADLRSLTMDAKLPIINQIRLLSTMLDPVTRMLPILPELLEATYPIRHAFASPTHVIKVPRRQGKEEVDSDDIGETFGQVIAWLLHRKVTPESILAEMKDVKVNGVGARQIAMACRGSDVWLNTFRTLFEVPCPLQKEVRGCMFYPQQGNYSSRMERNTVGVKFYSYHGREEVEAYYLKKSYSFVRYGALLLSVKAPNRASRSEVVGFLARLAVFMKWGFSTSRETSIRLMEKETFNDVISKPWLFLSDRTHVVTKQQFDDAARLYLNVGPLEFTAEQATSTPKMVSSYFTGTTINLAGGSKIQVGLPRKYPSFPLGTETRGYMMGFFQTPLRRLKTLIHFYLVPANYRTLIRSIHNNQFEWENEGVRAATTGERKEAIHATARALLIRMTANPEFQDRRFIAMIYCFASGTDVVLTPTQFVYCFQWAMTVSIDFRLNSGAVQLHEGLLKVNGEPVVLTPEEVRMTQLVHFAPGWRIIEKPETRVPMKPFSYLCSNRAREGDVVKVSVYSRELFLMKDHHASGSKAATIQRQVLVHHSMAYNPGTHPLLERTKRPAEDDLGEGPSQRRRLDSQGDDGGDGEEIEFVDP